MNPDLRAERRLRRWLRLYPPAYRRRYADDMVACFIDRIGEVPASDPVSRQRIWRRTVADLVLSAAREWHRSSLRARPLPSRAAYTSKGDHVMMAFWQDIRFNMRTLARRPAYALFVTLTLALGIGTTTSVFSVVSGVLLRPLPYPNSDRLVSVQGRFLPESGFDFPSFPLSNPEYLDFRSSIRNLSGLSAYRTGRGTIGGPGAAPESVRLAFVTPDFFEVMQQQPLRGRTFTVEEGRPGAPDVVLLSEGYWRSRFGGDPALVGQTILINNVPVTVVGVAAAGFSYPADDIRMWRPLVIDPANPGSRGNHGISAIGRLAPVATFESLEAEAGTLMARWKADYPTIHTGHFLFVMPEVSRVVGDVGDILVPLLAATFLLLLIVCANVSAIALARGESRSREMAVRTALGAGRGRLVRLALTETLLLGLAGGMVGVAITEGAARILVASGTASGLPRLSAIHTDWGVLAFGAGVTLISAFIVGLVPAMRAAGGPVESTLRQDGRTASASAGRLRFRRALVAAEVALTVVLVLSAALMIRSLDRVTDIEPGFSTDGTTIVATVSLPAATYESQERVLQFYDELTARLGAEPGVTRVSGGSFVPFFSSRSVWDFQVEGRPPVPQGQPALNGGIGFVRPGYFDALGIPLIRGRAFTAEDRTGAEPVVVVDEALGAKFFPGADPLGQRLRTGGEEAPWMRIIGIVGNVRHGEIEEAPLPMYYLAQAQTEDTIQDMVRQLAIIARVDGAPDQAFSSLRAILTSMDAGLPVLSTTTAGDIIATALASRRFATSLFGVFAAVGLLLGATGIYGVLAYAVAQRTQEIGIRRALGAQTRGVAGLMLLQAFVPVAIGLTAGLAASAGLSRWIEGLLFGVTAHDASMYALASTAVIVVALISCLIPVRRALRIDPAAALRQ